MASLTKELKQFRFTLEDNHIIIYDKDSEAKIVLDEVRHDSFLRFSVSAKKKMRLNSNRGLRFAFWKRLERKNSIIKRLRETIKNLRERRKKWQKTKKKSVKQSLRLPL